MEKQGKYLSTKEKVEEKEWKGRERKLEKEKEGEKDKKRQRKKKQRTNFPGSIEAVFSLVTLSAGRKYGKLLQKSEWKWWSF